MLGRTNTGGGGGLSFKVVGGTTAHDNPKENTIWVNTDTPISEWRFSANAPFGKSKVKKSSGYVISANDASDNSFSALTLYGKTIQNGTPTPEAPVPLESVGADGNVAVTVCGKNLLRYPYDMVTSRNGITVTDHADGSITLNGTVDGTFYLYFENDTLRIPSGDYFRKIHAYGVLPAQMSWAVIADGVLVSAYGTEGKFTVPTGTMKLTSYLTISNGGTINARIYPQIEKGSIATTYEPYKEAQTLTAQTPNGLPGIPVSSGGNYTDENGQQWICDEVDFEKGVYVQRVGNATAFTTGKTENGLTLYTSSIGANTKGGSVNNSMCNVTNLYRYSYTWDSVHYYVATDGTVLVWLPESFNAIAAPIKALVALAEEKIIHLTAEEIAQYSALHTNYPNTTIYNDGGAWMTMDYTADYKDGIVWIATGTTSTAEFNALKNKNGIQVYPLSAKQYVAGDWVDKDAYIYQGGRWNYLWNGELYTPGNEWKLITGGWQTRGLKYNSDSDYVAAPPAKQNTPEYMEITASSTPYCGGVVEVVKDQDLTNYDRLVIDFEASVTSHTFGLIVIDRNATYLIDAVATLSLAASSSSANVERKTAELDISGLSGTYDIAIRSSSFWNASGPATAKIYSLKME